MKHPTRNVVVEYKNRRVRKGDHSLWGNLDLKSIAREVEENTTPQPRPVDQSQTGLPESIDSKIPANGPEAVSRTEEIIEPIADAVHDPEFSAAQRGPEKTPLESGKFRKPDVPTVVSSGQKKLAVRRRERKSVPAKQEQAAQLPAKRAIRDELSALEIENVVLKRRLIAKLRAENRKMRIMLGRLEKLQVIAN